MRQLNCHRVTAAPDSGSPLAPETTSSSQAASVSRLRITGSPSTITTAAFRLASSAKSDWVEAATSHAPEEVIGGTTSVAWGLRSRVGGRLTVHTVSGGRMPTSFATSSQRGNSGLSLPPRSRASMSIRQARKNARSRLAWVRRSERRPGASDSIAARSSDGPSSWATIAAHLFPPKLSGWAAAPAAAVSRARMRASAAPSASSIRASASWPRDHHGSEWSKAASTSLTWATTALRSAAPSRACHIRSARSR